MRYNPTSARLPKFRATFFRSGAGREPVRDWLLSLPKQERRQIGKDIAYVQYKWPIGKPRIDHLQKTQRTSTEDIKLAEKRWKEWQHGKAE
jgi:phage-related protein